MTSTKEVAMGMYGIDVDTVPFPSGLEITDGFTQVIAEFIMLGILDETQALMLVECAASLAKKSLRARLTTEELAEFDTAFKNTKGTTDTNG